MGLSKLRQINPNISMAEDILGTPCDRARCGVRLVCPDKLKYHREECHDKNTNEFICPECLKREHLGNVYKWAYLSPCSRRHGWWAEAVIEGSRGGRYRWGWVSDAVIFRVKSLTQFNSVSFLQSRELDVECNFLAMHCNGLARFTEPEQKTAWKLTE